MGPTGRDTGKTWRTSSLTMKAVFKEDGNGHVRGHIPRLVILIIWDVDGTLIDAAGAGHRALSQAIRDIAKTDSKTDPLAGLDYAGQSDRVLMEQALSRIGRHPLEDWESVRDRYRLRLQEELAAKPGRILPGVERVLTHLAGHEDYRQVLGTGNLEEGAWLKLRHYGLASFFETGGFGDHHRSRPPILRDALSAARQRFGLAFPRAVVIGDTPRDAQGADAVGLPSILVATGRFAVEQLTELQKPVLPDLQDLDRVIETLHQATITSGSA